MFDLERHLSMPPRIFNKKLKEEERLSPSSHHVRAGLILVQPGGFVLDQLLSPVAHRRPAAARLLGRVDQALAVRRPGAGRVEDLARLHPADFAIVQQVSYEILPLEERKTRKKR